LGHFSKNYRTYTEKFVTKLSKIWIWDPGAEIRDLGSGINLLRIPGPGSGSRGQKAPDPDPQHWKILAEGSVGSSVSTSQLVQKNPLECTVVHVLGKFLNVISGSCVFKVKIAALGSWKGLIGRIDELGSNFIIKKCTFSYILKPTLYSA
jgi:hypothetical protein